MQENEHNIANLQIQIQTPNNCAVRILFSLIVKIRHRLTWQPKVSIVHCVFASVSHSTYEYLFPLSGKSLPPFSSAIQKCLSLIKWTA